MNGSKKVLLDLEHIKQLPGGIPAGKLALFCGWPKHDVVHKSGIAMQLISAAINRGDKVLFLSMESPMESYNEQK